MFKKIPEQHTFSDTTFQLLCSQIDSDYTAILRRDILPKLHVNKSIKLRELRTLMVLKSFDTPMPSATIAQFLRFDKGTVSRAVKILKSQNYISCLDNPEDKRSPFLNLTGKGQTLAAKYVSIVNTHFAQLSDRLGRQFSEEERKIVLEVLFLLRDRSKNFVQSQDIV